jgi:hypothetical protein
VLRHNVHPARPDHCQGPVSRVNMRAAIHVVEPRFVPHMQPGFPHVEVHPWAHFATLNGSVFESYNTLRTVECEEGGSCQLVRIILRIDRHPGAAHQGVTFRSTSMITSQSGYVGGMGCGESSSSRSNVFGVAVKAEVGDHVRPSLDDPATVPPHHGQQPNSPDRPAHHPADLVGNLRVRDNG